MPSLNTFQYGFKYLCWNYMIVILGLLSHLQTGCSASHQATGGTSGQTMSSNASTRSSPTTRPLSIVATNTSANFTNSSIYPGTNRQTSIKSTTNLSFLQPSPTKRSTTISVNSTTSSVVLSALSNRTSSLAPISPRSTVAAFNNTSMLIATKSKPAIASTRTSVSSTSSNLPHAFINNTTAVQTNSTSTLPSNITKPLVLGVSVAHITPTLKSASQSSRRPGNNSSRPILVSTSSTRLSTPSKSLPVTTTQTLVNAKSTVLKILTPSWPFSKVLKTTKTTPTIQSNQTTSNLSISPTISSVVSKASVPIPTTTTNAPTTTILSSTSDYNSVSTPTVLTTTTTGQPYIPSNSLTPTGSAFSITNSNSTSTSTASTTTTTGISLGQSVTSPKMTPGATPPMIIPMIPSILSIAKPTSQAATTPLPCSPGVGCLGNCTHALSQIPLHLSFEESKPAGLLLAEMKHVVNVTISVKIKRPTSLANVVPDLFNVTSSGTTYSLIVTETVDLEGLYEKAGYDPEVNRVQIEVSCREDIPTAIQEPPRLINVTIIDVDDMLPTFDHPDANTECVIPIYTADTSEDYMGELSMAPATIKAVDGDMVSNNNISYTVMHSEPEDYHVYFDLDMETGVVNKTRRMNASDSDRYVLFVKASEDSPLQKSRVAVVSIVVVAASVSGAGGAVGVNPSVKMGVTIASVLVPLLLLCGVVVLVHHRYRVKHTRVRSTTTRSYDGISMAPIRITVYKSPEHSPTSSRCDIATVASPSHVTVGETSRYLDVSRDYDNQSGSRRSSINSTESQKKRKLIVKKPLDTNLRPGWNAPSPKPKRVAYQPFKDWKKGS